MTPVDFIGVGPGAADLLTLRARDRIARCDVCLYAGSLIPSEVLAHCPPQARQINTAPMALAEIVDAIERAYRQGLRVVRLHSGDLSIWSAMGEQLHALRARGIPVTLTPGVPAFAAAAAALQLELTVPWASQSVVLTRLGGRASPVPDSERLEAFAATGATLAIHLSVHRLQEVVQRLLPYYGADCPVAVVWRASWPDERVLRARLGELQQGVEDTVQRTALILVGRNLDPEAVGYSRLYAADYERRFRPLTAHAPASGQAQE